MECDFRQKTGLVQILPSHAYYQIAFNKHGELENVVDSEGFGITSEKAEDRLFGQGSVLVVRNLVICQNTCKNDDALFKPVTLLGIDQAPNSTDANCDEIPSDSTSDWHNPAIL
jgi:hypothetical protein